MDGIFVVIHSVKQIVSLNTSTSSTYFFLLSFDSNISSDVLSSHVHLFKYDKIEYSSDTLAYTRVGLGDPYNNSFLFQHCRLKDARTSCFHVRTEPNEELSQNGCYNGYSSSDEIDDHQYALNEPLVNEKSTNNRVLMSRTNNLMPHFVNNLIKFSQ